MGVQSVIMAKGSSMSGASQNVNKGGGNAAGAMSKAARPAGAPVQRQRPQKSSQAGAMLGGNQAGGGILRFYTDDAPGLKIGPVRLHSLARSFARVDRRLRRRGNEPRRREGIFSTEFPSARDRGVSGKAH